MSDVKSVIARSNIKPRCFRLELTESLVMDNPEQSAHVLSKLKKLGIGLSIDDFGTGYSSLGSLTAFPFNKIKIDKSFIGDLPRNYKSTAIICTIVTLACGLDMTVTVEGVETREQFERLKALGVNYAQGYLMGRPVPIDELERQPLVFRSQQDEAA